MSERIEKAFKELVEAVNEEAIEQVEKIKTVVEPILTQTIAQVTTSTILGKVKVEDLFSDLFKNVAKEEEAPKPVAAPTEEEKKAVIALRSLGKSDKEIASILDLKIQVVETVK